MNSFRAELGGILAAIHFTINMAKKYNIQKGSCEIKADNYAVIQIAGKLLSDGYPQSARPSFDLLRIMFKEMSETDIKFIFTWVKGHQDQVTPYMELTDEEATANCRVDQIAASMIRNVTVNEQPKHDMDEGPYLSIDN